MKKINLYRLMLGDKFIEDCQYGCTPILEMIRCEGQRRNELYVIGRELEGEKEFEFFYHPDGAAYSPQIYLVEDGDIISPYGRKLKGKE